MVGKEQSGSTLIEVLIAVLVLSVGLVGMATLQFNAVRLNHDALLRSHATSLAQDIADSLRANPGAAINGDYNIALAAAAPTNPASIANIDLARWKANLAAVLPAGDGSIVQQGATPGGNEFTVTVCWDEDRGGGAPNTCFAFATGW